MTRNRQLVINMSASYVAYGVSLLISFFLSPYIVRTIGVEANGYVGLANSFVSYAGLLTIALNSLAGRFITVSLVQGETDKARRYFSSVFFANLLITAVLFAAGLVIVVFLERLIKIPAGMVRDVRLLFICLFLNCLLSVAGSVFSVATFARNKLYLESLRNIEANLARAVIIVGAFALFSPQVWYVGLGSLVSGVYVLCCNLRYTRKLLPEIRIHRRDFHWGCVRELISSGIWNTVNRLGQLLLDGLDLIISNLFISPTAMGVLSLSKSVPSLITGLLSSIVSVFSPNFTILFAQGDREALLLSVRRSMKIMGLMINVPILVLLLCGREFFSLWQPTQDALLLQRLFALSIACLIFSGGINCLYGIFTVVNKVRANAIVVVASGAVSTMITLLLVKTTSLGVFAIAGVSSLVSIVRNLAFTAPYGARCLGLKWYSFYPEVFRPVAFVVIGLVVGLPLGGLFAADSWLLWFVKAAVCGVLGLILAMFVILSRQERRYVVTKAAQKLGLNKGA